MGKLVVAEAHQVLSDHSGPGVGGLPAEAGGTSILDVVVVVRMTTRYWCRKEARECSMGQNPDPFGATGGLLSTIGGPGKELSNS